MLILGWLTALAQLGLQAMLCAAAIHLLRSALWALRHPLPTLAPLPALDGAPFVTVQLPLRNERDVAERIVRAACALDWPRDRIEVQVLDDSDDETRAIVDRVAAALGNEGRDVQVVRREGRAGYKAGALEHALSAARGEYVLILDADCVPPRDLLRRLTAPLVADGQLAFVQARWGYHNEQASLLTRAQAAILDALFAVEQARLSGLGRPVQFNGTSGVWRASALRAAGGWLGHAGGAAASVTEDLDLSYRVQLGGLRGVTLPALVVTTELPSQMAAFRAQQSRWVRGAGEVLRTLMRKILRDDAPTGARATMVGHLLRHTRQPLLVALLLWLLPVELGWRLPLAPAHAWTVVLALLLFAVATYFAAARSRIGKRALDGVWLAPLVIALSLGLAPALTSALVSGAFSRRAGEFVRTPKSGDARRSSYRAARSPLSIVEALAAVAYAALALWLLAHGQRAAGITVGALVAFGLGWVGFGSLAR